MLTFAPCGRIADRNKVQPGVKWKLCFLLPLCILMSGLPTKFLFLLFFLLNFDLGGYFLSFFYLLIVCWLGRKLPSILRTLLHCSWNCKLVQPLWKTIWMFPKKLKIGLLCNAAVPPLGIYPDKTVICKDTCIHMFTAAIFPVAKTWNNPDVPQQMSE